MNMAPSATSKAPEAYRNLMTREEMYKSLNTLVGLIDGIALDAQVNSKEISELQNWYSLHRHLLAVKPFNEIVPTLDDALQDGIIDEEEAADITWLCKRFLDSESSDLYFDAVTSNLQQLHGIIHGILADGVINDKELDGLSQWLNDNDDLAGFYPYDEIYSLLLTAKEDGVISDDERNMLKAFFATFIDLRESWNISAPEINKLQAEYNIGGICAVDPEIIFDGRTFCFTGASSHATRSEIASIVTERGGIFSKGVSRKTDYLIVGAEGNPCWAYSCYGRKVEDAMQLRKNGHHIALVNERDFWDALGGIPEKCISKKATAKSTCPICERLGPRVEAETQPGSKQAPQSIPASYIVLDIETTGFSPSTDKIIEISAHKYVDGVFVDSFDTLINPCCPLPPMIQNLTGITPADLEEKPRLSDIRDDFLTFLGNWPLVGHNIISFDLPFIEAALGTSLANSRFDTLRLARQAFPQRRSYKLGALNADLGLSTGEAHRAASDVETTNELFRRCISELAGMSGSEKNI